MDVINNSKLQLGKPKQKKSHSTFGDRFSNRNKDSKSQVSQSYFSSSFGDFNYYYPSRKKSFLTRFIESINLFSIFKQRLVSRMFWGRSNYYKNLSHAIMVLITVSVALTGIALTFNVNATDSIQSDQLVIGTNDLLQQGGSIQTVLSQTSSTGGVQGVQTKRHSVTEGESLDTIAAQYKVSKDTIRWASTDIPELFFSDNVEPGWVLNIPDINGVLHVVQPGETIDSVIAQTSINNDEANRFNIIEFNNLEPPYNLEPGSKLFIPDGNLRRITASGGLDDIPKNAFTDPLSHPDCGGYNYSRGYTYYHNGVDLARWPGCPIAAAGHGVIEYAGWAPEGQGYMVRIVHNGGIKTEYFHGSGQFWVKAGDVVQQGQPIMMMGSTGYSTGTHLHFILWKDGIAIDPEPYVPYNKYY